MLAAARGLADFTVVDCGFCLETDEELSFDTLAPRRNGATLAVLDDADLILVVGSADPIGMQRLVRGLGELRDAEVPGAGVGGAQPGARRRRAGRRRGGAARRARAVRRPDSGGAAAGRRPRRSTPRSRPGGLLGESSPGSPLRLAVAELAAALAGRAGGAARRAGPGAAR